MTTRVGSWYSLGMDIKLNVAAQKILRYMVDAAVKGEQSHYTGEDAAEIAFGNGRSWARKGVYQLLDLGFIQWTLGGAGHLVITEKGSRFLP